LPKINFIKIIKADRDKVFEIYTNFNDFQKTLPQYFPSIRVRSVRDDVSVVEEHIKIAGKELIMMTKHVTKPPELHEVFVIGGDAKGSHIIEKYEKVPQGTKITVDADLKLDGILKFAGFFRKDKIKKGFAKILDEFAKIAERK
jgi:hypothetical protein